MKKEKQKEESLNKTVAHFTYKKKYYEIDWLTDADDGRIRVYDLFGSREPNAYNLHQFETIRHDKKFLIKEAKQAIDEYCIKF